MSCRRKGDTPSSGGGIGVCVLLTMEKSGGWGEIWFVFSHGYFLPEKGKSLRGAPQRGGLRHVLSPERGDTPSSDGEMGGVFY